MDAFEYVAVVVSIVMGLAVTQLLSGIAQLYRMRSRIRTYWLHSGWTALLLLVIFLLWWSYWNYRNLAAWDFFSFLLYLSSPLALYFLTAIAFPDPDSETGRDLKTHYFSNRGGFFGIFASYGVWSGLTAILIRDLPLLDPSNAFRLFGVAILLVAMRSASERVHAAVFATYAGIVLYYAIRFNLRIG